MVNLVHVVAVNQPLFAVFALEDGTPDFRPVVALGTMQSEEDGRRVLAGFPVGEHLEAADFKKDHLGYTATPKAEEWAAKCAERREKIRLDEAKAKLQKIIVPNPQIVPGKFEA